MSNCWIITSELDIPFLKSLGVILDKEISNSDFDPSWCSCIDENQKEFHATISDDVEEKLDPYFYRFIWGPL